MHPLSYKGQIEDVEIGHIVKDSKCVVNAFLVICFSDVFEESENVIFLKNLRKNGVFAVVGKEA